MSKIFDREPLGFPVVNKTIKKKDGVLLKARKAKARRKKLLLDHGWTTDGVWWINPRSGLRYDYDGALSVFELRNSDIDI